MIHLTFTGISAGVLLCGETRENKEVNHAVYAPLNNSEFRKSVVRSVLTFGQNTLMMKTKNFLNGLKKKERGILNKSSLALS